MLRLDEIFYKAITADADLMQAVGGLVKSTCFEVSPEETDNTPLPYIIIIDEGKAPAQTTKDDEWMPSQWRVSAGVEVGAVSPNEVDALVMMAMKAIAEYISTLSEQGEEIPYLNEGFPQTQGIAWDWTKPCYFDVAHYQCDVDNKNDDEQEESDSGI
jgi:hypothetical protein